MITITGDGDYTLIKSNKAKSTTVYISGTFAGTTLTVGIRGASGSFQALTDLAGSPITFTGAGTPFLEGVGRDAELMVNVAGTTTPDPAITVDTKSVE